MAVEEVSKKARVLADMAEASLALALETIKPGRTSPLQEVRVGGTLRVTETGVEMLNSLGTKLRLIEAAA